MVSKYAPSVAFSASRPRSTGGAQSCAGAQYASNLPSLVEKNDMHHRLNRHDHAPSAGRLEPECWEDETDPQIDLVPTGLVPRSYSFEPGASRHVFRGEVSVAGHALPDAWRDSPIDFVPVEVRCSETDPTSVVP